MQGESIIIVDLTRDIPRIGVTTSDAAAVEILPESVLPWRVALREEAAGIVTLAGEDAVDLCEDDTTIVFDYVPRYLPRLEDPELQSRLARACWGALCCSLSQQGLLQPARRAFAYIIPNRHYPPSLLDRWRASCADERRLRLAGFVQAPVSLLVGFLHSTFFNRTAPEFETSSPVTISLVTADETGMVDVICFEYSSAPGPRRHIRIRDYFQATCDGLFRRLKMCDWLGRFSILISISSTGLTGQKRAPLEEALNAVSFNVTEMTFQTLDPASLKLNGAAHIAQTCVGRSQSFGDYFIQNDFHIGIGMSQHRVHPIIDKEKFVGIVDFPYTAVQALALRGHPGNELRLNLYCGYSAETIEESTPLAHLSISQQDLALLSDKDRSLLAVIKLDGPGSGEFTIGLLPDDKKISSLQFTLPGLIT